MDNGNIDVGNELRIDNPLKTARQEKPSANASGLCGAMSQQGGEFRGNVSAPQEFVRLVGCSDRKAKPGVEGRQYSNQVKR